MNTHKFSMLLSLLLVLLLSLPPVVAAAAPGLAAGAVDQQQALDTYLEMPLYFIANRGQQAENIAYYAQGGGYSLAFSPEQVALALDETVLKMRFAGAKPTWPVGLARQAAKVNYLLGSDPARWQTNIPTYGQVLYRDLYPGIDLYYEGQTGALKYTVVAAPGADVARFSLAYEGVTGLQVDETGNLLILTDEGHLRDTRPYAYQEIDGQRVAVKVAFVLRDSHTIGFTVQEDYNPAYPLVIDPTLEYATYLGGSENDRGWGIAIDGAGYLYVAGQTFSSDFPTQGGVQADQPYADVFVAKIDPGQSGAASLVYSTYLGGKYEDVGYGIDADDGGSAYVTGYTTSHDFPTTANAYQPTPYDGTYPIGGNNRVFVSKLSADGSSLLYSTYLRYTTAGEVVGARDSKGWAIAVDGAGVAYVTGETHSPDFPTTPNAYQASLAGDGSTWDAFFTQLDTTQSGAASLLYSTYYGGTETERGLAIAVDSSGSAYITGQTNSSPDLPTQNPYQGAPGGDWDAFLARFSSAGGLLYATYLGAAELDWGEGVAADDTGSAYLVGVTESSNFPTQNPYQSYQGGKDAFVTKIDTTQSGPASLLYSTYLGGYDGDECSYSGCSIAVDGAGSAYVAGSTGSSYFPIKEPYRDDSLWADAFVTKFNSAGDDLVYSTYLGGNGSDGVSDIVLDKDDNPCVAGMTTSTQFFDTKNPYQADNAGKADAFVIMLGPSSPDLSTSRKQVSPTIIEPIGTVTHTLHYTLTLANSGNLTATTAYLTDTLPLSLTLTGGPVCSGGVCGYSAGDHLVTWSGSLAPTAAATITYTGQVSVAIGTTDTIYFVNKAQLSDGVSPPLTRTARSAVNPIDLYLPYTAKSN